ncbi:uncharacterized protein [Typha latifolia]|uniref:uncharacterized protein isoform X1 n=2 Tax=Typha latifolia TaxID=4733 RepID=UPI003C2ECDA3
MERRKYPSWAEDYNLLQIIGEGATAIVHRALCVPLNEIVAIKILDFERPKNDLTNISREAKMMLLINHPNVLSAHCSFVNDHSLWVVMPYMAGGSCLHIMKSAYPRGFEEVFIATVLRETLKGLEYLHQHGHIHRDVKAGNILVDARHGVKLGDFGVSACLFDSGDRQRTRTTFVGTPCWMAPEVMERKEYDFKADIWSFGITALELAHGHAPFSSHPPSKVLLMTLQHAPPSLHNRSDKKFSRYFKQMIAMCLVKNPLRRPSAQKLLKQPFFKQAKSNDYIVREILNRLPCLDDRLQALKEREAKLLAEKKLLDVQKEEMSQNEYRRGISSWNFDIGNLKAQASMIPENEDNLPARNPDGFSNSVFELVTVHETVPLEPSPTKSSSVNHYIDEENDWTLLKDVNGSLEDQTELVQRVRADFSEDEPRVTDEHDHNVMQELTFHSNCGSKTIEKNPNSVSCHELEASTSLSSLKDLSLLKGESGKQQDQLQITKCADCSDSAHASAGFPIKAISRTFMATASNGNILDENVQAPVVHQKGCFKVTAKNDELHQMEKSDRSEMELLKDIADLQWRLLCAQEELERLKVKNAQVNISREIY